MIPLGAWAHSTAANSKPTSKENSLWRRPKSPKSKRVQSSDEHLLLRPSASFQSARKQRPGSSPSISPTSSLAPPFIPAPPPAPPLSFLSAQDSPTDSSPRRPKHVPIVIPNYASLLDAYTSAESKQGNYLRTPRSAGSLADGRSSSECTAVSDAHFPSRKASADSGKSRPRHVEIVIPDWAQPLQPLLDSPGTALVRFPSQLSPPNSAASPLLIPPAVAKMVTRTTAAPGRPNAADQPATGISPTQQEAGQGRNGSSVHAHGANASQTSLHRYQSHGQDGNGEREQEHPNSRTPASAAAQSTGPSPAMLQTAGLGTPNSTSGLSGLVCNVHRTTGREPHPLVGATTTVLGDKLYVFGGRRLSRSKPQLTNALYELDLVRRHWTKLDTRGDVPAPRYFHSVCALGDTKLVCYGGMSPARPQSGQGAGGPAGANNQAGGQDGQPDSIVVMSDVHIYDVPSREWMYIPTKDAPQGRYAHCAAVLPSAAVFSSSNAPMSAIRHNPASSDPNKGSIGVNLDGTGGAEMIVVGGQDSSNHYIEQISVFNLRSLQWTSTVSLGKSCGAYRSVVAPLTTMSPSTIGSGRGEGDGGRESEEHADGSSSMLIYSNYNFLDVQLELQVRLPDGSLSEKHMQGSHSPPGLRFPNGGVIDNHFVVSGTFLTSSKQEYALWALDLRTLTWSRIDAGGNIFGQGSWNRGVLWNRRNTFVILGNRRRSLVEDYNHRRINFSNICMVELEAFGLYDNPRRTSPMSKYLSVSSALHVDKLDKNAGGRQLSQAAVDLGQTALGLADIADMDLVALNGERIPVNSRVIARRWGPYFNQLLREGATSTSENADTATLRPTNAGHPSRNSSVTITPSIRTAFSAATTLTNNTVTSAGPSAQGGPSAYEPPEPRNLAPNTRPRTLYLPHTHLTIQSLVHYLYTSSLPPPNSPLCTTQILCSMLQFARPYHIDGLREAVIERLHHVLDGRNTAAIFNAAAMAAGGGDGVSFFSSGMNGVEDGAGDSLHRTISNDTVEELDETGQGAARGMQSLRINTDVGPPRSTSLTQGRSRSNSNARDEIDEVSSATSSTSVSDIASSALDQEIWAGEVSAVVGLQKRGLRGLMEGRRMREMRSNSGGGGNGGGGGPNGTAGGGGGGEDGRVGLGIA